MKKRLEKLEIERNLIAFDRKKYPIDMMLDDEEFTEMVVANLNDFSGCNHQERKKFLMANGYEVNHKNMTEDLSCSPINDGN